MKFSLGGSDRSYNSKRSQQALINMLAEQNNDGTFKVIKRTEGLSTLVDLGTGPIRSDILINSGFAYVVSGTNLYRFDTALTVENLGAVSGSGRAKLAANSFPGDNQIFILNGLGAGFTFKNADGLELVTDPDFFPSNSVTVLNERFWFSRTGTNEFFGSDLSDGKSFSPLTFGTADEKPDNVIGVIAKRSANWVVGERTIEYWQSTPDPTFPLRRVQGATIERGCVSINTLAELEDSFAFLADDSTVRLVGGNQSQKISDLNLELRIKGDGTAVNPGYTLDDLQAAFAFWLDDNIHKVYCLFFPTKGFTWCFDLVTGLTHIRESTINFASIGRWRANTVGSFLGKIIIGDYTLGRIWSLDPSAKCEGDEVLIAKLRTPSATNDKNLTIPLVEIDMEVGVGLNDGQGSNPLMMVTYFKDGITRINHEPVKLGAIGDDRTRVPIRDFGRLVRNKDFILELRVSDPVRVQFYGADWFPRISAW